MPASTISQTAIGIDIGADRLHIATSVKADVQIVTIDLTQDDWHERLAALIPFGAVVAYEPTGWHYSAPIVALLHHIGAHVIVVEHRTTGMVRALKVSGVKNDPTDARALCHIAAQAINGSPYFGSHAAKPDLDGRITALRMLIWSHHRATKETTRCTNRLHQLSRSIWPTLDQKLGTYLNAVRHDAISPRELRQLIVNIDNYHDLRHATRRKSLIALVNSLPDWLDTAPVREAIAYEAISLAAYQENVERLELLIERVVSHEPFTNLTRLWLTIPGSGIMPIASLIVATHGEAATLTPAQFRATVGSHPRISQSGETSDSSAARQGFKPAKKNLYLWTMRLLKDSSNPIAHAYKKRAASGRKYGIQAARAKLCHILSGVARTGTPYNPDLYVDDGPTVEEA